tara:strand:- start:143 stop:883 length:741 start_codon:yes stop_codon:yes gene_type:complete
MLSVLNKFRKHYCVKPEVIIMPINTTKILQKAEYSWNNDRNEDKTDNKKEIIDKFREILNKLCHTNFDFIKNELCSYINNNNINKDIIEIFYEKICLDHKFTELYIDILINLNNKLKINIIDILINILNNNFNKRFNYLDIDNDLVKDRLKVKIIGSILLIVYLNKKKLININYYFNELTILYEQNKKKNDFNIELLCILLNNSGYKNDIVFNKLIEIKEGNISKRNKFLILDVEDNLKKYRKKIK